MPENPFLDTQKLPRIESRPSYLRKPQRITITVPWKLYQTLIEQSNLQGRSLSNLACHWMERQAETIQEQGDQAA